MVNKVNEKIGKTMMYSQIRKKIGITKNLALIPEKDQPYFLSFEKHSVVERWQRVIANSALTIPNFF